MDVSKPKKYIGLYNLNIEKVSKKNNRAQPHIQLAD